jgi:hypothetical protein
MYYYWFLVGSSPSVANLEDMTEAHENHPVFTGLKLAAFEQSISLAPGKSLLDVFAVRLGFPDDSVFLRLSETPPKLHS